ncbi:MAG TPA: helix-turn-helix domain-containing protein, partial [Ktedonobacterales bacterium]
MRTFEYRLYLNHRQRQHLMACLKDARGLYNEMLEATKAHYAETGTFLFKYDLMAAFKGRAGEHVPATTVQTLADRLDKALKRYLVFKEQGIPCGFPRFKNPNRW